MTKADWQPSSWLDYTIGSFRCFKWENIQPEEVAIRMPDLIQHLQSLVTGFVGRTRGILSRNYASPSRFQTDRLPQTSPSTPPQTNPTRIDFDRHESRPQ